MEQPLPSSSFQDGTNGRTHTCEETLRKVLLLLDHEMSDSEQKLLMLDIQSCEDCLKKYNIEKEFKAFMHAKFVKKQCTSHLRTQIQDIVRTQIN